jgi:hypothetical protein
MSETSVQPFSWDHKPFVDFFCSWAFLLGRQMRKAGWEWGKIYRICGAE